MSSWPGWDTSMRDDERVGPGFSRADDGDAVIDAAAQSMTRGEPTAQLRTTVRARIERNQAPWRLWGRVAMAGAAAFLLIVVARTFSGSGGESDQARHTPVQQTVIAPRVEPAVDEVSPPPRVAQVTRPRRRPTRALDPIAPLVIEPMTTPLMAVGTSSGVKPIEINDLRIEPLQIQ